jgi:hypothetical protein
LSFRLIADQKVNYTFHHPRTIAFAWMYSGGNEDSFFLLGLIVLRLFLFIRYCNVLAAVTCNSSRQ